MKKSKKPTLCYLISDAARIRCVQSIPETKDFNQIVVCKDFREEPGLNNHISNIKIKNYITYRGLSANSIIRDINPDVLFIDKYTNYSKIFKNCLVLNIAHGERYALPQDNFIKSNKDTERYKFCGYFIGSNYTKSFLTQNVGIKKDCIFVDSMPQLDLIQYKQKKDKNTLLFMGHISDSLSKNNAKNFFQILFKLNNLSHKMNFNLMVRPRTHYTSLTYILKNKVKGTIKDALKKYQEVLDNERVCFVNSIGHGYGFYSMADVIVGHSSSTVEVEAAYAGIPYLRVANLDKDDYFNIANNKCNLLINDLCEMEYAIEILLSKGFEKDTGYLEDIGLDPNTHCGKNFILNIKKFLRLNYE